MGLCIVFLCLVLFSLEWFRKNKFSCKASALVSSCNKIAKMWARNYTKSLANYQVIKWRKQITLMAIFISTLQIPHHSVNKPLSTLIFEIYPRNLVRINGFFFFCNLQFAPVAIKTSAENILDWWNTLVSTLGLGKKAILFLIKVVLHLNLPYCSLDQIGQNVVWLFHYFSQQQTGVPPLFLGDLHHISVTRCIAVHHLSVWSQ